jgi:hypothetical protein
MHSGFTALRGRLPDEPLYRLGGVRDAAAVQADLDRIDAIWSRALDRSGGPFLYGNYTLADVFYAPVATRIATYGLSVSDTALTYVRGPPGAARVPPLARHGAGRRAGTEAIRHAAARAPFPPPDAPPARRRPGRRKTPRAPIPANRPRILPRSAAASSASATPFAGTRPWRTPRPGPRSWKFTIRKRFARSR